MLSGSAATADEMAVEPGAHLASVGMIQVVRDGQGLLAGMAGGLRQRARTILSRPWPRIPFVHPVARR